MKSEFVGKRLTFLYVLFDTMAFVCHGDLNGGTIMKELSSISGQFTIPQPDQQILSYALECLAQEWTQPLAINLTDLYAVSVPEVCRLCPHRKNTPNCTRCNQCRT